MIKNKTKLLTIRKFVRIFVLLFVLFIFFGFIEPLSITHYDYTSDKIPKDFDGYKIVQLSDFHCKGFGMEEDVLINKIKKSSPDLIVLTGDMVDESHPSDNLNTLLSGISDIAPIYAILGNHDTMDQKVYNEMLLMFEQYNVTLLPYNHATITKNNSTINIYGTNFTNWAGNCIVASTEGFNLLLFHDANAFPIISKYGFDVILSGHTHGGIVRIPGIGGLIGNDKKLFPTYTSGKYVNPDTNCTMFASRGLGDTEIPRFYNSPEIVELTLHSK
ncbi:MAG: metallophosphoesterase [Agathobacter sp.]|nr:metallophosphoesterase [Agathobacter sp.]